MLYWCSDWYFPDGTRLPFSGGGDIYNYMSIAELREFLYIVYTSKQVNHCRHFHELCTVETGKGKSNYPSSHKKAALKTDDNLNKNLAEQVCVYTDALLVSGGCQLSDLSLCLLHGSDSGQPFLCGHQSCGRC